MITLAQLQTIIPPAGRRAGVFLVPLNEAMAEFGIDTPARQAAFLAQIAHESGSFRYVAELASGRAYDGREDLGNTRPEAQRIAALNGTPPGPFWKGHGLIQITGYDNHRECGIALGIDCVNKPGLLELPVYAARSAAWFWWSHDLNSIADAGDFRKITRVINGGFNGYAERLAFYEQAQEVLA
jgi:putative chitinase